MTLTTEQEKRLKEQAASEGLDPAGYIKRVIERIPALDAPQAHDSEMDSTLALFARWDAEDATDDPAELLRRKRQEDELMENLRKNRLDFEGRTNLSAFAEK